jgi:acetolactate synthase-1/2/3 large subunit
MKVAEYVFDRLAAQGVRDVFIVSGGGIMHLVDALGAHPAIRYWCNQHEQACAIAAEAYARVTGNLGVCLVTTGPGSTNALSGLAGAWLDSIPVLAISGQVRTELIADYSKHRQIGHQEINIVPMAQPVTKYAKTLMPGDDVRAELDDAIERATSGRPGPVWLNIPLDVQNTQMEDLDAARAARVPSEHEDATEPGLGLAESADAVIAMLRTAKRPVIVAGYGIHSARAESLFEQFVDRVGCPVATTIAGMDLLYEDHSLYLGRFGPTGLRRANFTVQNADLLLCIGASMSVGAVGYDTVGFAPNAKRVMVNVDPDEMTKPNFPVHYGVVADARAFMTCMLERSQGSHFEYDARWLEATSTWKQRYPLVTADYETDTVHVNSYVLANRISMLMQPGEVMLSGNGLDAVSVFHSFAVKPHQRVLANSNFGAMGWDMPAAIGACVARGGGRTVLMVGDGSIQMNIQELMTIGHNRLNIKVFVLNNGGYESIRATQSNFFEGRLVGCDMTSGVANPRFDALATAYGLEYRLLRTNDDLDSALPEVFETDGPFLCEVNVSYTQEKSPRIVSRQRDDGTFVSSPLDNQYPFLPEEEHNAIMGLFADE